MLFVLFIHLKLFTSYFSSSMIVKG